MKKGNRNYRDILLFIAPTMLLYTLTILLPVLISLLLSFTKYEIISSPIWVGWSNYIRAFTNSRFLNSFLVTMKFMLLLTSMHILLGLFLALLIHSLSKTIQPFCRIVIYFPVVLTAAAVAIAWGFMFQFEFGMLNYFIKKLGLPAIPWLIDKFWVYTSITLFSLWKGVGSSFLFFYIGINSIPDTFFEAAKIDGSNRRQTFFKITLPMITPTLFFVLITMLIGTAQMFNEPFLFTQGGPKESTMTISFLIYEQAYKVYNMGSASSLAMLLFITLIILTIVQIKGSNRWVHYGQE